MARVLSRNYALTNNTEMIDFIIRVLVLTQNVCYFSSSPRILILLH